MSKMKELEQVAEFMATTTKETLMQNAEWAIDGTSLEELEGDDYYNALEELVSKTIEILYKQNETTTG
jgi:hypothetical protein